MDVHICVDSNKARYQHVILMHILIEKFFSQRSLSIVQPFLHAGDHRLVPSVLSKRYGFIIHSLWKVARHKSLCSHPNNPN